MNVLMGEGALFGVISGLYSSVSKIYELLISIVESTNELAGKLRSVADTLYVLIGIFMLFRIGVSLIQMLIDPDKINDKQEGGGKLVGRIAVSLVLFFTLNPLIFPMLETVEKALIGSGKDGGVITKFIDKITEPMDANKGANTSRIINNPLILDTYAEEKDVTCYYIYGKKEVKIEEMDDPSNNLTGKKQTYNKTLYYDQDYPFAKIVFSKTMPKASSDYVVYPVKYWTTNKESDKGDYFMIVYNTGTESCTFDGTKYNCPITYDASHYKSTYFARNGVSFDEVKSSCPEVNVTYSTLYKNVSKNDGYVYLYGASTLQGAIDKFNGDESKLSVSELILDNLFQQSTSSTHIKHEITNPDASYRVLLDSGDLKPSNPTVIYLANNEFYSDSAHTQKISTIEPPGEEGDVFFGFYALGLSSKPIFIDKTGKIVATSQNISDLIEYTTGNMVLTAKYSKGCDVFARSVFSSFLDSDFDEETYNEYFEPSQGRFISDKEATKEIKKTFEGSVNNYDYDFLLSVVCGIIVMIFIFILCIDVIVRGLKLIFLQIISPIAVLSYINPKDKILKEWVKMYASTYADLFLKLFSIQLAIKFINYIVFVRDDITGIEKIIFIGGIFLFAKALPEFISKVFGLEAASGTFKAAAGLAKAGLGFGVGAAAGIVGAGSVFAHGGTIGQALGTGANYLKGGAKFDFSKGKASKQEGIKLGTTRRRSGQTWAQAEKNALQSKIPFMKSDQDKARDRIALLERQQSNFKEADNLLEQDAGVMAERSKLKRFQESGMLDPDDYARTRGLDDKQIIGYLKDNIDAAKERALLDPNSTKGQTAAKILERDGFKDFKSADGNNKAAMAEVSDLKFKNNLE